MLQISEGGCGLRIMGVIPTETPENRRVVQWLTLFFLPVFPVSAGIIRLEPVTNGGPSPFKLLKRESIPWERVPRTLLFA